MKSKSSVASMVLLSAALLGMSSEAFSADNKPGFFSRMFDGAKAPGVAPV